MQNPVEQLKKEYDSLVEYLNSTQQPSLISDLNKNFRKVLLLSAGSYFEHEVTTLLSNFVRSKSNNDDRIINFLEKQAISQKYHTLFSWGEKDKPDKPVKNANTFFKLFGDTFKTQVELDLKVVTGDSPETIELKKGRNDSIEAFIEIGHLRNILVHSNFAAYNYDQKTTDEIFNLFKKALPFLEFISQKLS